MPSIRCWPTLSCAIPRHHLVAAIADDRLVGFISALDYWHPDKPRGLWINEVGVAPTWQHRGAGTRHLLMRQSRVMWLVEAMTNVVVGYALSVSVQPWCSRCSALRRRCGRASASARSSPWSRWRGAICCGEFSRRCPDVDVLDGDGRSSRLAKEAVTGTPGRPLFARLRRVRDTTDRSGFANYRFPLRTPNRPPFAHDLTKAPCCHGTDNGPRSR